MKLCPLGFSRFFAFTVIAINLGFFCAPVYGNDVQAKSLQDENKPTIPVSEATDNTKPNTAAEENSGVTPNQPQATEASAQESERFDLFELRIKGNHLLKDVEIERTVYPFLGPKKDIETVEKARKALEDIYRTKGYQTVSVDIPEQDVVNGVVNLQVVEGKVSRLRVTDSHYFSLGKIKEAVPELAEGKVPNFPVMQKQIEDLSALSADRSITPILRAGDTPGTLEADLKVKDELPLHGRVELNGRNTATTSRLRLVNSIHYDNLWQMLHSASLMYQVSPENSDEVEVWAGTYAMPLPFADAKLAFYAVSSNSNASVANAGALSVIGIGQIYGLRFIKPLTGFDKYSHNLTLGVDYKDFKEDITFISADTGKTPISYLPFLVEYGGNYFEKTWKANLNLGLNFGVRGLVNDSNKVDSQGNITGEFETKRAFAKPNYVYLTADAGFSRDLPYDMELIGRFSGQVADSPLISNEQFSMGGMQSVRGYFETQALVDDGFTASLELQSPRLAPLSIESIDKLQAMLFVDGGYGRIQKNIPGNASSFQLASTGLGVRFQVLKYLDGVLDLGIPLLDLDTIKAGHPKLHFSIAAEF